MPNVSKCDVQKYQVVRYVAESGWSLLIIDSDESLAYHNYLQLIICEVTRTHPLHLKRCSQMALATTWESAWFIKRGVVYCKQKRPHPNWDPGPELSSMKNQCYSFFVGDDLCHTSSYHSENCTPKDNEETIISVFSVFWAFHFVFCGWF